MILSVCDRNMGNTVTRLQSKSVTAHEVSNNNSKNCGVSYAVNRGILEAKNRGYESVILMDSDGQHSPKYIPKFDLALKKYDFVNGCRFENYYSCPSCKLVANGFASGIISELLEIKIRDVACGFKGFHISDSILDALNKSDGYSLVYDIVINKLKYSGSYFKEISISAIYYEDELWYTRYSEIIALIGAIKRNFDYAKLMDINFFELDDMIQKKMDFEFSIEFFKTYGFFIKEKDGYILQADLNKVNCFFT